MTNSQRRKRELEKEKMEDSGEAQKLIDESDKEDPEWYSRLPGYEEPQEPVEPVYPKPEYDYNVESDGWTDSKDEIQQALEKFKTIGPQAKLSDGNMQLETYDDNSSKSNAAKLFGFARSKFDEATTRFNAHTLAKQAAYEEYLRQRPPVLEQYYKNQYANKLRNEIKSPGERNADFMNMLGGVSNDLRKFGAGIGGRVTPEQVMGMTGTVLGPFPRAPRQDPFGGRMSNGMDPRAFTGIRGGSGIMDAGAFTGMNNSSRTLDPSAYTGMNRGPRMPRSPNPEIDMTYAYNAQQGRMGQDQGFEQPMKYQVPGVVGSQVPKYAYAPRNASPDARYTRVTKYGPDGKKRSFTRKVRATNPSGMSMPSTPSGMSMPSPGRNISMQNIGPEQQSMNTPDQRYLGSVNMDQIQRMSQPATSSINFVQLERLASPTNSVNPENFVSKGNAFFSSAGGIGNDPLRFISGATNDMGAKIARYLR